jgi:three-Cys-motif partner protein
VTTTANYVDAPDGHTARIAPEWTELKLTIVKHYLQAFATAVQRWGAWDAVDVFAGPGLNVTDDGRVLEGSPLLLLNAARDRPGAVGPQRVVAMENHPANIMALKHRLIPYPAASVIPGDSLPNLPKALAMLDRKRPSIAIVDPEGFEVPMDALQAIADHRVYERNGHKQRMEMLALVPTPNIVRLYETHNHARLAAWYGTDDFLGILERRFPGAATAHQQITIDGLLQEVAASETPKLSAPEAAEQLFELYATQLKGRLGYAHVVQMRIRADRGRPMYDLVLATDNDTGAKIMRDVYKTASHHVSHARGRLTLDAPRTLR